MVSKNQKKGLLIIKELIIGFLAILLFPGCNYNFYQGTILEKEERIEEANIEYHRAFTSSPGNEDYREAYLRTSQLTASELMLRYEKYLAEQKFNMAFNRLEQARALSPDDPEILQETRKWYRILLAGKASFKFKSLRNQISLTDKMTMEIRFNTPNATRRLSAAINNKTGIFNVEDVLYDPPQSLLLFYSINSIGVKLSEQQSRTASFQRFIDFRTPMITKVQGKLKINKQGLKAVDEYYPYQELAESYSEDYWVPMKNVKFEVNLAENVVNVSSSNNKISFLPQIVYFNFNNQRIFLDFGEIEVVQKRIGGIWSFRRNITKERNYLAALKRNIILNPYFYFSEGSYPVLKETSQPVFTDEG